MPYVFEADVFAKEIWRRAIAVAIVLFAAALVSSVAAQTPTSVQFPGTDDVVLQAALYMPKGTGPFPAVIAMHGCSGLRDKTGALSERHRDWAERLSAQGFIVLLPDSFASRGLGPQCRNSEREVRPSRERVADVKAAFDYVAGLAQVKPSAINLLGWSNGGSTVLYAIAPKNVPAKGDFARAIAFYPGCRVPLENGRWHARLPLLILMGEADDWTPVAPCKTLAEEAAAQGEKVQIKTYPDAYHDFDHPNLPVHVVEHLAFTASGGGSAHTGTNEAARKDAIEQVLGFLAR
ncbi:dienelactone hydrolase family protein [Methyloferula stellata]|uniref:dienelactone hydrolase family protein n=1 Tax=Methyloferula stellata TaxID=876270 RepID=UPI00037014DD|nr:dienelactone hydrolase family protein [Methyloferula stellata]